MLFGRACRSKERKKDAKDLASYVSLLAARLGSRVMARSRKGNLAILFKWLGPMSALRGGHELSENRAEEANAANHVGKTAPNHPSLCLFSATKSMIISSINDNESWLELSPSFSQSRQQRTICGLVDIDIGKIKCRPREQSNPPVDLPRVSDSTLIDRSPTCNRASMEQWLQQNYGPSKTEPLMILGYFASFRLTALQSPEESSLQDFLNDPPQRTNRDTLRLSSCHRFHPCVCLVQRSIRPENVLNLSNGKADRDAIAWGLVIGRRTYTVIRYGRVSGLETRTSCSMICTLIGLCF